MIASVVIKGKHSIGVNSNNKIKVDGQLLALNEVPFMRYRFESYGDEELEYIKKSMDKFKSPVHLIEITLDNNTASLLDKMSEDEVFEGLAKFLYVNIDDNCIANGLSDETRQQLESIKDFYLDRIMLKDKSSGLYPLAVERLRIEITNIVDFEARDIGICGSSMSFRCGDEPGQACLTAVWARQIQAIYANSDDCVTPTSSHEKMTCCGCIQYLVVDQDCPAPLSAKEKSAKEKSNKPKGESSSTPKFKPINNMSGASRLLSMIE